METQALLARQEKRLEVAHAILRDLDLLARWRVYGSPYLVGATAYGLVVAPDIDLEIYCPGDPRIEDGMDILRACALHARIHDVQFINEIRGPDQGCYWQLHYRASDGQEWKVDMWSVRYDHPGPTSRDLVEPLRRALTDETRAAILDIKEQLRAGAAPHTLSIHIYRAVVADGVRTLAEFQNWRSSHPAEGMVSWRPE